MSADSWSVFSGSGVAADHRPVNEVTDSDRERDNAKGGSCPDVTIRLNTCNQSESSDVAECATYEQNASAAGTRRLVQLWLHRNVDSAGNRREAFFAAQLADPVVGIQRAEGDTHPQNHGH